MMESKICSKCGVEKPIAEYHKARDCKLGVRAHCKACLCRDARNSHHAKRDENVAKMRERRASDPEAVREYHRNYYAENTERRRAYLRKWREANREGYLDSAARSHRKRYADPQKRLEAAIRAGVHKKLSGSGKSARTFELLGFTPDQLKGHLERQFAKGMTWANFGKWHVDHVMPLSSFDYESADDEQFRRAWALSNLRPLWADKNLSKGAKRLTLL